MDTVDRSNEDMLCGKKASLTYVEELQKRLQEKIKTLQAQRKAAANDPEKQKKKVKKLKTRDNKIKGPEANKTEKSPKKAKLNASNSKPVFNKDGNLLYSIFDFTEDGLDSGNKGKKVKTLFKKAEKKKEKIENLKSIDPDKAKTVEEKEKWKSALLKTQGLKVKDDPNLLKKTLKREEHKKKKSTKAWKERKQEVQKRKNSKQERRTKNINKRKKEKLNKKIISAKKKGRVIPGF